MKKITLLLCLFLVSFYSCNTNLEKADPQEKTPSKETPISEKEKAINQVVLDAYRLISFEKGTTPDFDALKAIFTADATLYNFRGDSLSFYNIQDFVAGFKSSIDAGGMIAFNEVELGGETEYFGKIGHRISAYASYFDGSEEIGEKGVNSFQVLHVNGKWLINSIIWDVEKSDQSIPEKYLTEKSAL